jgi:hypothetical protein
MIFKKNWNLVYSVALQCAQELLRLHDGAAGWRGFGSEYNREELNPATSTKTLLGLPFPNAASFHIIKWLLDPTVYRWLISCRLPLKIDSTLESSLRISSVWVEHLLLLSLLTLYWSVQVNESYLFILSKKKLLLDALRDGWTAAGGCPLPSNARDVKTMPSGKNDSVWDNPFKFDEFRFF